MFVQARQYGGFSRKESYCKVLEISLSCRGVLRLMVRTSVSTHRRSGHPTQTCGSCHYKYSVHRSWSVATNRATWLFIVGLTSDGITATERESAVYEVLSCSARL